MLYAIHHPRGPQHGGRSSWDQRPGLPRGSCIRCCFSVPALGCSQPVPGSPPSPFLPSFLFQEVHTAGRSCGSWSGGGAAHVSVLLFLCPPISLSAQRGSLFPECSHSSVILPLCQALGLCSSRAKDSTLLLSGSLRHSPQRRPPGVGGLSPGTSRVIHLCAFISLRPRLVPRVELSGELLSDTQKTPEPKWLRASSRFCPVSVPPAWRPRRVLGQVFRSPPGLELGAGQTLSASPGPTRSEGAEKAKPRPPWAGCPPAPCPPSAS